MFEHMWRPFWKVVSWTPLFLFLSWGTAPGESHVSRKNGATVIRLTQTPCQFVESEATPKEYQSNKSEDCIAINKRTAGQREFKTLRLKPGKVIFRVTNKNVPYELGFWVRGRGVGRVTLPSTSGGGLMPGQTKDYTVTLEKGSYWYSCPLNPTPDYPLVVE